MVTATYKTASPAGKSAVAPTLVGSVGIVAVWVFSLFDIVVPADVAIAMAVIATWILNRTLSKV